MIFRKLVFPFLLLAAVTCGLSDVGRFSVAGVDGSESVEFFYRQPEGVSKGVPTGVLLLVPGSNGSGKLMLDERWCRFADEHALLLLAPSYQISQEQIEKGKGYYCPEQGSGRQLELALAEVRRKTGVKTDKVLIFGFSAGAHFAHRFALWKPERVAVFVAHSAAWWSDPKATLREVPALIMCGEKDVRYGATWEFFQSAQRLHLPWVWRSYKEVDHEITPVVRRMAEVFLAHYAGLMKGGGKLIVGDALFGDIHRYRVETDAESIPETVRIRLPSQAVAEQWRREK